MISDLLRRSSRFCPIVSAATGSTSFCARRLLQIYDTVLRRRVTSPVREYTRAPKFHQKENLKTFDVLSLTKRARPPSAAIEILNRLRLLEVAYVMAKQKQMYGVVILDHVPWSEDITDYDRLHFVTYVRLLDAMEVGTSEEEICRILLGIDSAKEPKRAKRALLSHLRRARWMTENGYRRLLQ